MIQFAHPVFLWLIPPALAAGWLLLALARGHSRRRLEAFVRGGLWPEVVLGVSRPLRTVRDGLGLCALLSLLLALADPQFGTAVREVSRRGLDMQVVLDVSRSMLTDDVKPSRLERAKLEIRGLVDQLRGDRVGLVLFAGTAYEQCPATLDYNTFKMFLNEADPSVMPRGGTALAEGILRGTKALEHSPGQRVMVLVTDGEDLSGRLDAAIQEAQKHKIAVYTLPMGTAEGAPIRVRDAQGGETFVRDARGEVVLSKANPEQMARIASATGGRVATLTGGELPLDKVYETEILKMERTQLQSMQHKQFEHRFQWPLFAGLLFLVIEAALLERRPRHA